VSDSSNNDAKRNAPEITDPELAAAARMISVDARKVVLVGTVLFFAAFVVLLPFWSWLGEHGHRVWLWTALAGTVLGVAALPLIRKHTGEGRLG
jgi:hypothetical protein